MIDLGAAVQHVALGRRSLVGEHHRVVTPEQRSDQRCPRDDRRHRHVSVQCATGDQQTDGGIDDPGNRDVTESRRGDHVLDHRESAHRHEGRHGAGGAHGLDGHARILPSTNGHQWAVRQ